MDNNQVIVAHSLAGRKNALEFTRKIYGYTEHSNHSKYKYERKGILSDIPYEKISRGCFMINKKYEERVTKALIHLGLKNIKILEIHIIKRK